MSCCSYRKTLVGSLGIALLACGVASAQFTAEFEPPTYSGSADGTILTGQDLFYLPTAESVDFLVYTYADNALGIPDNPAGGGTQFAAGTGPGDALNYARGERVEDGTWGDMMGQWTASFDVAAIYLGELPSAQNLGSWSTQPDPDPLNPTKAGFIALAQWTDPATAATWDANYLNYDAAGAYVYPAVAADPAFQGLATNHWYRWSTTVDFDTNMIVSISITDLLTGTTATEEPVDWYLGGGATGGLPGPTGFRLFAGASAAYGNTLAFDNIVITPAGGCVGDIDGDGVTDLSDLATLLAAYETCVGDPGYIPGADFDDSGCVDLSDLAFLLADYGCGT